jgi:hypothetical protein
MNKTLTKVALLTAMIAGGSGILRGNPQQSDEVSVTATETFASKYVKSTGSPIGNGPVQQSQLDLNIGKYFTATAWQDYDTGRGKMDEIDVDLTLHKTLHTIESGSLKGQISGGISIQDWIYPSGFLASRAILRSYRL